MSELSAELRPKGKQLLAKGSNFASLLSQSAYDFTHILIQQLIC